MTEMDAVGKEESFVCRPGIIPMWLYEYDTPSLVTFEILNNVADDSAR